MWRAIRSDPAPWYLYFLMCNPLSSGVSKVPTDLLLVNRICLMWLGCKTTWLLSCPFTLSLPLALNYLVMMNPDAILWAPLWRGPWGKELRVASDQREMRTSVQQSSRNWILPRTTWMSLGACQSAIWALRRQQPWLIHWLQSCQKPWTRGLC